MTRAKGMKKLKKEMKKKSVTAKKNGEATDSITNVNTNHAKMKQTHVSSVDDEGKGSSARSTPKKLVKATSLNQTSTSVKKKNTKISVVETVVFEEDGEMISMEINDGGAAANEFASGEDYEQSQGNTTAESEDSESGSKSETCEVEEVSEQEETASEADKSRNSSQDNPVTPKRRKKMDRKSMEEKLDTLSDALFGLKEMFLQKTLGDHSDMSDKKKKDKQTENSARDKSTDRTSNNSNSDTTVYQNALLRTDQELNEVQVDNEISFKKKANRDSSSSEDRMDTSDETLEFDAQHHNELNQRFISDYKEEAQCRKRGYPEEEDDKIPREKTPREIADDKIREAEAAKARILTTPGKVNSWDRYRVNPEAKGYSALVDDNYVIVGAHIDNGLKEKNS